MDNIDIDIGINHDFNVYNWFSVENKNELECYRQQ